MDRAGKNVKIYLKNKSEAYTNIYYSRRRIWDDFIPVFILLTLKSLAMNDLSILLICFILQHTYDSMKITIQILLLKLGLLNTVSDFFVATFSWCDEKKIKLGKGNRELEEGDRGKFS